MCNEYQSFSSLPKAMQLEAIREGEERVKAQLTVANNADQRALSWARLHIGSATAAFGASLAFLGKDDPDYYLAAIALIFALLITLAGFEALKAGRPDRSFHLPGNTPSQWLPDEKAGPMSKRNKMRRARREQAECLADQIAANAEIAEARGNHMDLSFDFVRTALILATVSLFLVLIARVALAMNGVETTVVSRPDVLNEEGE